MTHPNHPRDMRGLQQGDVLIRWIKGGPAPARREMIIASAVYAVAGLAVMISGYFSIVGWLAVPTIVAGLLP